MRAFDRLDDEAACEIQNMMAMRDRLTQEGDARLRQGDSLSALIAYEKAQHLSFHAGEGLKVRIMNEDTDRKAWHELEDKIQPLKKAIYGPKRVL